VLDGWFEYRLYIHTQVATQHERVAGTAELFNPKVAGAEIDKQIKITKVLIEKAMRIRFKKA
jgi:hypothetical protein